MPWYWNEHMMRACNIVADPFNHTLYLLIDFLHYTKKEYALKGLFYKVLDHKRTNVIKVITNKMD